MGLVEYFTPVSGTVGGGLIGLSAAILLLFSGEILGCSGIASSVVLHPKRHLQDPQLAWKLVFISTFLLFSNVCLGKYFTDDERLGSDPSIPVVSNWGYLLGGLFVGFGTRLGNGCTTGHGICGMARLSIRSVAAVCAFMLTAFATSAAISPDNKALAHGTAFLRTTTVPEFFNRWLGFGCSFIFVVPTIIAMHNLWKHEKNRQAIITTIEDDVSKFFPNAKLSDLLEHARTEACHCNGLESDYLDSAEPSLNLATKYDSTSDIENPTQARSSQTDIEVKLEAATDVSSQGKQGLDKKWAELQKTLRDNEKQSSDGKILPAVIAACIFSSGLAISQMVLPSKVLGFLSLYTLANGTYDPTLITVMVGGSVVSFLSYQFVEGWGIIKNPWARSCPLTSSTFCVPTNKTIDWKLILGSCCFGVGWATAGLCPGPAVFLAASGTKPVLAFWWPFYYIGAIMAQQVQHHTMKGKTSNST